MHPHNVTGLRETHMTRWHRYEVAEVIQQLATDARKGLSCAEANRRLAKLGPNELRAADRTTAWSILLAQFKNVLMVILLVAVGLSVFLGHGVEALNSGRSLQEAMTMTFMSLVLIQFVQAYCYRSDRHSVLRQPFANRWLNLAVLWE